MHILVDENIPQGREVFSAHGTVTTFHGRQITAADVRDANALIVRSITKVNADLLEGSSVRFVGTATIGVDHIDQAYLRAHNIGFSAAPGCNARSVAEYFVSALLHLHVTHGLALEGKTLGVVGYGNVGRAVAAIAPALGLKVLVSDPPLEKERAEAGEPVPAQAGGKFLPLHELAARADILTFHTPLTKTGPHPTLKMANRDFFTAFKTPKTLMNMGRGEAFDEPALLEALDAGKVERLVLDVFPGEPGVNPALASRADLITPHIAGYSIQGKLNGTAQILTAFQKHFEIHSGLEALSGVTYPLPENPVIVWGEEDGERGRFGDTTLAEVFNSVRRSYDIGRDDTALRACFENEGGVANGEFPKRFDALRKNYPIRHEFARFRVANIHAEKRSAAEKLTRLGFSLE